MASTLQQSSQVVPYLARFPSHKSSSRQALCQDPHEQAHRVFPVKISGPFSLSSFHSPLKLSGSQWPHHHQHPEALLDLISRTERCPKTPLSIKFSGKKFRTCEKQKYLYLVYSSATVPRLEVLHKHV